MTPAAPNVRVTQDRDELALAAAEEFVTCASHGTPEKPCRILLSGGTTPEPMYRILASEPTRSRVDWNSVECYFGDERPVPPDHPESNYGLLSRTLLEPLGIRAPRTYRIRGETSDLTLAAMRYEALIRNRFAVRPSEDPAFDIVFLGLGEDGHTASLFPGVSIPADSPRLFVAVWVDVIQAMRATATYRLLNAARRVLFLVAGKEKAAAVKRTLAPEGSDAMTPAARVAPHHGKLTWLLDRDAASGLSLDEAGLLGRERR